MDYFSNSLCSIGSFFSFTIESANEYADTLETNIPMLENWYFLYLMPIFGISILLYIITNYILFVSQPTIFEKKLDCIKRALLVTAHPDDECMFFGPIITHLSHFTDEVYLICLSNGGFEGLGDIRSKELWMSCCKLGLKIENIRIYKHGLLPDNPNILWDPAVIARIIIQFVETMRIDTLITFDAYGISGHSNHIAIYKAVMCLTEKKIVPDYCKIYVLETVNIVRKYSICIDILLSYCTSQYLYISSPEKYQMILQAMAQHSSQLVWYRRLYLVFSRYCYLNTIKCIK